MVRDGMKTAAVKKLIAAACVAVVTLSLWHTSSGAQEDAPRPPADEKRAQVKELFVQRCARCHGRDGRGATKLGEIVKAPDFTDAGWWEGVSDARLRTSIAKGKGEMPDFGKKLTRAEIAALAAHVRAFAPEGRGER